MIVKMPYSSSLMRRLQWEDGEYNGMCCHDCVLLWPRPQRVDGCAQTSCYVSQPTEKVRHGTDQSGKSNQRYSNLNLCLFLTARLLSQADADNNAAL